MSQSSDEENRRKAYEWCADAIAKRSREEASLPEIHGPVQQVLKALRVAAAIPPTLDTEKAKN